MARGRRNRLSDLGELQLQVLDILTELGEGTVYDVIARFPAGSEPRYTTILTVLRGLERKGLARHTERDRAFVFRLTREGEGVRRNVLREFLGRVFDDSPKALMATLLDVDAVTPDVIEELTAMLEEHKRRKAETTS